MKPRTESEIAANSSVTQFERGRTFFDDAPRRALIETRRSILKKLSVRIAQERVSACEMEPNLEQERAE